MFNSYIKRILQSRVYDVAEKTRLDYAPSLSARLNNHIWIKREDLQPVFSFKIRGAYNKIVNLPQAVQARGVIAASAGNHAQGVALSGKTLGIRTVIVMPKTTPDIKVSAVRRYGAEVILHGTVFDDASRHAHHLMQSEGLTYVPPFDDEYIIAGQGTVGMEILQQHNDEPDAIFIPVGGGGLLAGMAAYIKYLRPDIKIIGVEPYEAPSMYESLKAGEPVELKQVGLFADGAAVRQVGELTFEIAQQYVDEILLVSTDEICAAIKDIFEDTRTIAEPAGALGLAGLKQYVLREQCHARNLITINSGANMNFDRLGYVTERTEIGEQREALITVTIPERPGSFREFCHSLGQRPITEFNYRYASNREAHVFVGIRLTEGEKEKTQVIQRLQEKGYTVTDITDNELAREHIRHMVGGHVAQHINDERVYRFEFPERPGALLHFLTKMGHRWNISLFHYRNHGSTYGRVMTGVQVPEDDLMEWQQFLSKLGYTHWEECDNKAYHFFLN